MTDRMTNEPDAAELAETLTAAIREAGRGGGSWEPAVRGRADLSADELAAGRAAIRDELRNGRSDVNPSGR